jgi:hypothetical protein
LAKKSSLSSKPSAKPSAKQSPLERIQQPLTLVGFETCLLPKGPESPFEQLLVALDQDLEEDEEAQLVLQLFFTRDAAKDAETEPLQSALSVLQFFVALPEALPEAHLLEAWRLCAFFTQLMPMGAFQITPHNRPYYRYCHLNPGPALKPETVVEILELISLFVNTLQGQLPLLGTMPLAEIKAGAQAQLLNAAR